MNTKTSLFKVLSVTVGFVLLINTAIYAMPADRSTLRTPSTAVAIVNAESREIKASSAGKTTLAVILAEVLALSDVSSATVIAANYNNQIKLQVQQVVAKRSVKQLIRDLGSKDRHLVNAAAGALKILQQNINIQQQAPKHKPDAQDGAMLPSLYPHLAKASSVNYQHTVEKYRASLAALIAA